MSLYYRSVFVDLDDDDDSDLFDLMSRRIELQHSLNHSSRYRPWPSISNSPLHHLPSLDKWSSLNRYNREPSFFPLAQHSYRFQKDYHRIFFDRPLKRRWKALVYILIFYFHLRENLRRAKLKSTYYQRDYHRLRFLELLTAVHRIYFEPNSPIQKCLFRVVHRSSISLIKSCELFIDQLTHFHPQFGILGTSSDESVLIYLLQCSLEHYPKSYFWSIERHLLSLSYTKMKEYHHDHLDHFTTKFIVIATFIFRGLTKTLLLKPVKYRLTRGQISSEQWMNTRLFSSLILSIARHAIMKKKKKHSTLPMPFPFEMKSYLFDDEDLREKFAEFDRLIERLVPRLSSWAEHYAARLQNYFFMTKKKMID